MSKQIAVLCAVSVLCFAVGGAAVRAFAQGRIPTVRATGGWEPNYGANGFAVEGGVVHVWHRAPGDTGRPSSASIVIPTDRAGAGCEISFSVRFGALKSIGSGVEIYSGDRRALYIGADGGSGRMGADLATKRVWDKPGDTAWHTVKLAAGWEDMDLYVDGVFVGYVPGVWRPSRLTFGSKGGVVGRQTEAWLRITAFVPHDAPSAPVKRCKHDGHIHKDGKPTCPECDPDLKHRHDGK